MTSHENNLTNDEVLFRVSALENLIKGDQRLGTKGLYVIVEENSDKLEENSKKLTELVTTINVAKDNICAFLKVAWVVCTVIVIPTIAFIIKNMFFW